MANYKTMNLAQRIKSRLEKLGKSERGASLEAGLSDSFLRNIRQNKSNAPRFDTLEKIAEVLQTTPNWLMTGEGPSARQNSQRLKDSPEPQLQQYPLTNSSAEPDMISFNKSLAQMNESLTEEDEDTLPLHNAFYEDEKPCFPFRASPYPLNSFQQKRPLVRPAPNAVVGEKFSLNEKRLPVYGQAVGGIDGEFPINGSTLYSVLCPPQLSEISGAYAVSISGDSMYPRYEDGEIAFVDPKRRVKKGDYVIAQIIGEEGEPPLAYVKKFICHNAGGLILEQFNPNKELHFPHERVVSVHYIALAGTAPN